MFKRILEIEVPPKQSIFIWGARQTGKSSYLKTNYPHAKYYDLLDTQELARFTRAPHLLREEILMLPDSMKQHPIIIDEIQKVPELLNEVHKLIEDERIQFILCGSSARKLKTQSTNLLGGRAWKYHFYPLTFAEIPEMDLLKALQFGLIPNHYLAEPAYIEEYLQAYVDIYLTDEIRNEGLVRNLKAFSQFLDVAGMCNGDMINANNIARDCGIDRTTVQGYYQILVDTLLGYYVYPYQKKVKRDIIAATPKFYLCDVGVANHLGKQKLTALQGSVAGQSFEHYIFMELKAFIDYRRMRAEISYWRTKTGLEVDFIIGDAEVAIEVKISAQVHKQDLKGMIAFCEEHPSAQAFVVSQDKNPRLLEVDDGVKIHILPWQQFLTKLWGGELFVAKVK